MGKAVSRAVLKGAKQSRLYYDDFLAGVDSISLGYMDKVRLRAFLSIEGRLKGAMERSYKALPPQLRVEYDRWLHGSISRDYLRIVHDVGGFAEYRKKFLQHLPGRRADRYIRRITRPSKGARRFARRMKAQQRRVGR